MTVKLCDRCGERRATIEVQCWYRCYHDQCHWCAGVTYSEARGVNDRRVSYPLEIQEDV